MKTLVNGEREFQKEINKLKDTKKLSGKVVLKPGWHGFPIRSNKRIGKERDMKRYRKNLKSYLKAHQEKSRAGSETKIKGGLSRANEITIAYHTATHL